MQTNRTKTQIMVECALMIALATVLGYIPIFEMPQGGSITLCSMAPIILAAHRNGLKWGLFTGFVHSLIQMLLGFKNVLYCTTFPAMVGCILLDYVIAFTALGLAAAVEKPFKNKLVGIGVGSVVVGLIRYLCSFLSGILIWGGYAPEDMPVWLYSLTYNGSYMIPEIIITAVAVVLLVKLLDVRQKKKQAA
ncbi:energy-coupled thiamine transporter ThiT [Clostridiaceae bacterium NSJ-31]|uniref:Energy-coupled thiamine transporter ThiT n=1 Tax=Ligaoa zhengdingensis TaxID=2763658 RepID=A0A926DY02_9FIRM|nr:energy-coupled thiamine transporter ThiT [Ligaoa zhengdingensis]MBC8545504.1 energy-coupled thiamine transporter ThiT [Ligaoa zhengdingensis]